MLKICSLRSGSSGNAILVFTDKTKILVDCGISGKCLAECMSNLDMTPNMLNGVLITHEHRDHTSGAGVIARRHGIPIYSTSNTYANMDIGNIPHYKEIKPQTPFEIGDVGIFGIPVPHDAAEPLCYTFEHNGRKTGIATDMGHIAKNVLENLTGVNTVLIEANYNSEMLRVGRYHPKLKERVNGNFGHLSNESAAVLAVKLIERGAVHIILGHLSEENNTPELAFNAVNDTLTNHKMTDVTLCVAPRYAIGEIIAV